MSLALRVLLMSCHLATFALSAAAITPNEHYSVIGVVPGPGGAWDYGVVDSQTDQLYLAQSGVTALDLATNKLTTRLVSGKLTHGVASLPDGLVAVDDAGSGTITVFHGTTGEIVKTISTVDDNPSKGGHALDALLLEPASGLLIAVNGDAGIILFVDYKQGRVIGKASVGDRAEFAAADGKGRVFINVNRPTGSEVDILNAASRHVERKIALDGCVEATGLAFDKADNLLVSVCGNGKAKFIDADSGRELSSINVGQGADAVMFDEKRHRVFVPSAEDGTLTVLAVRKADSVEILQIVPTQKGSRLGAVDDRTGRVYLPAAEFGAPIPPSPYPSVIPGTFKIIIVAPR